MTGYTLVLLVHSWLRWLVLGLGLTVWVARVGALRARAGTEPRIIANAFVRLLDVQVAFGLVLYLWLSPLPRLAFADWGRALGDDTLRFYSIEHAFGMVVALIAAHVGHRYARAARGSGAAPAARSTGAAAARSGEARAARSGEAPADSGRRMPLIAQTLWLVVTLVSIPWPFLPYGRPLFRLGG